MLCDIMVNASIIDNNNKQESQEMLYISLKIDIHRESLIAAADLEKRHANKT